MSATVITTIAALLMGACVSPALPITLCNALAAVNAGERMPVEIRGIYVVGAEHSVLYDPAEPRCRMNVQPATWIEFAPDYQENETLGRLLAQDGRAFVTFRGDLNGPGPASPDDPAVDAVLSGVKRRLSMRRYGHLSAFRTKLVVAEVRNVEAVPASVPWEVNWNQPPASNDLKLTHVTAPSYPELARKAGVSGEVVLDVTVTDGVVSAAVRSGDRMLSGQTLADVKTWSFARGVNTKFISRFIYRLEQRPTGTDSNPRLNLHLPLQVEITAAEDDW